MSEFNHVLTWTHNKAPEGELHLQYADKFDKLVRDKIQQWDAFHSYWLEKAENEDLPVFFFRYEDMLTKP